MSDTIVSPGVLGIGVGLDLSPEQFDAVIDRVLDPRTPHKPIGPQMPNWFAVHDSVLGISFAARRGGEPMICTWFELKTLAAGNLDNVDQGRLN